MAISKLVEPKKNLRAAYEDIKVRSSGDFFLAFIDGNGIKQVNDNYGHLMGDRIIEAIANTIIGTITEINRFRPNKNVFRLVRFGGDEFVLFLSGVGGTERLRFILNTIQKKIIRNCRAILENKGVSISIGVVSGQKSKKVSFNAMIKEADKLMYAAKLNAPTYVVTSWEYFDGKDKRREDKMSIRRRQLLPYIVAIVLNEHPEYNKKLVGEAVREVFRINGNNVLWKAGINELIDITLSIHKSKISLINKSKLKLKKVG